MAKAKRLSDKGFHVRFAEKDIDGIGSNKKLRIED